MKKQHARSIKLLPGCTEKEEPEIRPRPSSRESCRDGRKSSKPYVSAAIIRETQTPLIPIKEVFCLLECSALSQRELESVQLHLKSEFHMVEPEIDSCKKLLHSLLDVFHWISLTSLILDSNVWFDFKKPTFESILRQMSELETNRLHHMVSAINSDTSTNLPD